MKSKQAMNQSLATAYSVRRKAKKMADGGMVPKETRTVGEIIGYPGATKSKKMAQGGMVDDEHEMQRQRMEKEQQEREAHNAQVDESEDSIEGAKMHKYAKGGMVRPKSIAEAIMRKRDEGRADVQENGEEDLEPDFYTRNIEAADEDTYDLDQLADQPEDSNTMGDSEEEMAENKMSRIDVIRRRMKSMR